LPSSSSIRSSHKKKYQVRIPPVIHLKYEDINHFIFSDRRRTDCFHQRICRIPKGDLDDEVALPSSLKNLNRANNNYHISGLHHPNIVSLHGICLEPLAMIIDLVPDGPLDAFLTVGLVVLLNILNNTAKTRMQNEKYHGKHD